MFLPDTLSNHIEATKSLSLLNLDWGIARYGDISGILLIYPLYQLPSAVSRILITSSFPLSYRFIHLEVFGLLSHLSY